MRNHLRKLIKDKNDQLIFNKIIMEIRVIIDDRYVCIVCLCTPRPVQRLEGGGEGQAEKKKTKSYNLIS